MIRLFGRSVCVIFMANAAIALFGADANAESAAAPVEMTKPGRVLVLRHANAPGIGDPGHFRLGDCATQRNLDAAGRDQAIRLGRRLAGAGLVKAKVYSSQWCRCLETARLLALGPVEELQGLNSFFERTEQREAWITSLRRFLARLPADGPPIVLVTHQVTITALTGVYSGLGAGVILQLNGTELPGIVGEFKSE